MTLSACHSTQEEADAWRVWARRPSYALLDHEPTDAQGARVPLMARLQQGRMGNDLSAMWSILGLLTTPYS